MAGARVSDELMDRLFCVTGSLGQPDSAAAVYIRLCERVPRNEIVGGAVLNALTQSYLRKAGFTYFEKLLADHYASARRAMMQNAGLRMAQILEQEGQVERSLALLAQLRSDDAVNRTLLLQHVDAMSRAGQHREALTEFGEQRGFCLQHAWFRSAGRPVMRPSDASAKPSPSWNEKCRIRLLPTRSALPPGSSGRLPSKCGPAPSEVWKRRPLAREHRANFCPKASPHPEADFGKSSSNESSISLG